MRVAAVCRLLGAWLHRTDAGIVGGQFASHAVALCSCYSALRGANRALSYSRAATGIGAKQAITAGGCFVRDQSMCLVSGFGEHALARLAARQPVCL